MRSSTRSSARTCSGRGRSRRGNLRGGKAVLYVNSSPIPMAIGQLVKQQLAEIGLDVEVRGIPIHSATAAYFNKLGRRASRGTSLSASGARATSIPTRTSTLLFDSRFIGGTNFARFASGAVRPADAASGAPIRRRVSATVRTGHSTSALARDPAPSAALGFLNEPTLVSKRVGCIVLRPVLDLTAVCLES